MEVIVEYLISTNILNWTIPALKEYSNATHNFKMKIYS